MGTCCTGKRLPIEEETCATREPAHRQGRRSRAAGSAARSSTTTSRSTPQAAALVFPTGLLPDGQPDGRADRLAGDLRRRLFRPADRRGRAGAWGDRHGRKNVLVFAMFLMGMSTFAGRRCCPPTRRSALLAPLLLVLLRLVQGFAVAGELGGASAMIVEHSPVGRRGFFASFALQGTQAGLDPGHRRASSRSPPPARRGVPDLGLAHPVPAQRLRDPGRLPHPPPGRRDARRSPRQADTRRPSAGCR